MVKVQKDLTDYTNKSSKLIKGSCYDILNESYNNSFDVIFSDPKFSKTITGTAISKSLAGHLDYDEFYTLANRVCKKVAAVILIGNFLNALDIVNKGREYGWEYHTVRIRDKSPNRSWIAWSRPIRHTEFIVYMKRGKFKFDFRDGTVKEKYKRNSFGGELRKAKGGGGKNNVSYGMFQEIFNAPAVPKKKRKHPTQKPEIYSLECAKIVGKDKRVLDPMCGSGVLLKHFPNSLGIDLEAYWKNEEGKY